MESVGAAKGERLVYFWAEDIAVPRNGADENRFRWVGFNFGAQVADVPAGQALVGCAWLIGPHVFQKVLAREGLVGMAH